MSFKAKLQETAIFCVIEPHNNIVISFVVKNKINKIELH